MPVETVEAIVEHQGEWRDPAKLRPHPRNSRKHDGKQLDQMRASLRRFGVAKPVLIDEDDTIIAGHATTAAAVAEGYAEIPVVVARGWDDDRKRAYLIADNRHGEKSAWDHGLLAIELDHLKRIGDVQSLGFSKPELSTALRRANALPASTGLLGTGLQYRVIVDCSDEKHQAELLKRFADEGLTCRALIS